MKFLKLLLFEAFAITILLAACKKEDCTFDNPNEPRVKKNSIAQPSDGLMALGNQLEDPYALKNMKKAYSNLKAANPSLPDVNIQPTHLYLRFLPNTEEEWGLLKSDTSLVLFDYPLNFEIATPGTYYHDPSLPETAITWQYCVIPIKHSVPNVPHELLYEVYIPDDDIPNSKGSPEVSQLLLDMETESVNLTGNMPKGLLPSKWTPKGTIKVWDENLTTTTYTQVFDHWEYYDCSQAAPLQQANTTNPAKHIMQIAPVDPIDPTQCQEAVYRTVATTTQGKYTPLVGASVHARWFVHIERDLTDANGYFQTSRFRFEVNYSIKWERADFDIRSGNWGQAWFNGPKQKGDWNLNIEKGGMSWVYAHIHRGAYTYYYANTFGIKSPPKDGRIFKQRIHIGAMDKSGRSHYYDFNKYWLCPQIKIYAYDKYGNWCESFDVFGTTVHELAHASHWEIGYTYGQYAIDAIFSEPFLPESWAQGVEAVITASVYPNVKWRQDQDVILSKILGNGGYTPIVWDMIDDFPQRVKYNNLLLPLDNVSGYTLTQLENALYGHYTWVAWRDAIKNNYNNPTKVYLNELFANYKK